MKLVVVKGKDCAREEKKSNQIEQNKAHGREQEKNY